MKRKFDDDISKEKLERIMQEYYSALQEAYYAAEPIAHYVNRHGKISKDFSDKFDELCIIMDDVIDMVKRRDYLVESERLEDNTLNEEDIMFLKKYAGILSEELDAVQESMQDSMDDPINKEFSERIQRPLFNILNLLNSNFADDRKFHLRYRTDRSMQMTVNSTIEALEDMEKMLKKVKNSQ